MAIASQGAAYNREIVFHDHLQTGEPLNTLLPLFPLDLVLLPGVPLPLHIFEPRYKEMIQECLDQKSVFGMIRSKEEKAGHTSAAPPKSSTC